MSRLAGLTAILLLGAVPVVAKSRSTNPAAVQRCQDAVAEAGINVAHEAFASLAACDARITRGALPANTNCIVATATDRRHSVRFVKPIRHACRRTTLPRGGDCADATTADALAACIAQTHDAYAVLATQVLGRGVGALTGRARVCRDHAVHAIRVLALGKLGALEKCKRHPPASLTPGTTCADERHARRRIATVRDIAMRTIIHACPPSETTSAAFAGSCAGSPDQFTACVLDAADSAAGAAVAAEYPDTGFCGDAGTAVEKKIDGLLAQMKTDDKIAQMHGVTYPGPSTTAALPSLGIPGFLMNDGPRGVGATLGRATTFPVGIARGATWDPALETLVGDAMGGEARAKGATVLLAPTMNIVRHPRGGRTQESYGEDTYLLGKMAAAFIRGVQGRRVLASAKHFALNSIEDTRFQVNVSVDERSLREVYLPHFRRAVREGHTGSVMSAYNKVNGQYCAENPHLLHDVLKGDWGFQGFVESDWLLGTRSTLPSLAAGLDIEMPQGDFYGPKLLDALNAHQVQDADLDEHVRRILRAQLCFRLDSDPPVVDPTQVETPANTQLALNVAHEGIVLLKNANATLPVDRTRTHTLVVVGAPIPTPTTGDPTATTSMAAFANLGDFGSSTVVPTTSVTPLDGLLATAGPVTITHVASRHVAACTGDPSCPPPVPPADATTIANADAVVVVAGLAYPDEGEGLITHGDRDSLAMPRDQDAIVAAVAALNSRTIVVLEGSGPVLMPWIDAVPAVVEAWYPGEQGGRAIADVLFGDVNPSGRLPLSFPEAESDLPTFDNEHAAVVYAYFHGYRYLDEHGATPLFPFGHGLSYTTFSYANLTVTPATVGPWGHVRVSADVTNTGRVAGDEVAQLYVGYEGSRVTRAMDDLKGFVRVHLAPGETKTVVFDVPARDVAFWDTNVSDWEVEPITYRVRVGPSSRGLPLEGSFAATG